MKKERTSSSLGESVAPIKQSLEIERGKSWAKMKDIEERVIIANSR